MEKSLKTMSLENIHFIFKTFQSANQNPQTELCYHDAFTLLVAVMLSAQTTDAAVNKATPALFQKASTPQMMASLSVEEIASCIRTLNYYHTKAKHLKAMANILIKEHHGNVPSTREDLEALPGVGRKTANVVLNIAFHQPTLAVDTHIHRVANRLGLCMTKTPLATEQDLLKVIPEEFLMNAHHWLILHGRYTCKAKKPLCHECHLNKACELFNKN